MASAPHDRPVDHDWMFQDPDLFFSHLEALKLVALSDDGRDGSDVTSREAPRPAMMVASLGPGRGEARG